MHVQGMKYCRILILHKLGGLLPYYVFQATVLLLSVVVVVAAGIFHLYNVILQLLHKTPVQNKVVLITDSLSALGNGMLLFHVFPHVFHLLLLSLQL